MIKTVKAICLGLYKQDCLVFRRVDNAQILHIKDCNNTVVFKSPVGESKNNNIPRAYQEALKNALEYLNKSNYLYKETNSIPKTVGSTDFTQKEEKAFQASNSDVTTLNGVYTSDEGKIIMIEQDSKILIQDLNNQSVGVLYLTQEPRLFIYVANSKTPILLYYANNSFYKDNDNSIVYFSRN